MSDESEHFSFTQNYMNFKMPLELFVYVFLGREIFDFVQIRLKFL